MNETNRQTQKFINQNKQHLQLAFSVTTVHMQKPNPAGPLRGRAGCSAETVSVHNARRRVLPRISNVQK